MASLTHIDIFSTQETLFFLPFFGNTKELLFQSQRPFYEGSSGSFIKDLLLLLPGARFARAADDAKPSLPYGLFAVEKEKKKRKKKIGRLIHHVLSPSKETSSSKTNNQSSRASDNSGWAKGKYMYIYAWIGNADHVWRTQPPALLLLGRVWGPKSAERRGGKEKSGTARDETSGGCFSRSERPI